MAIAAVMAARESARRSPTSKAKSPRPSKARSSTDQRMIDRILCELDGTPNKSRLGANAHARRFPRGRPCRCPCARPSALSLPRRPGRRPPSGADVQHPQRRQARRRFDGLPGIHGHAGGGAHLQRGPGDGRRDLPRAESRPARAGLPDIGGRRRWLRALAGRQRSRRRSCPRCDRGGRIPCRRRRDHRPRPRHRRELYEAGKYVLAKEGRDPHLASR